MRAVLVILVLAVAVAPARNSSAESPTAARPSQSIADPSLANGLPNLLRALHIELLMRSAQAAECTREGETCTSNEQCCPGLECSGGPPATCVDED